MKRMKKQGGASRSKKGLSKKDARDSFDFGDDRRARYLAGATIDCKNVELLRKFMTEHGKIMPRRITGTSAKQQRQLKQAIRQARTMGLARQIASSGRYTGDRRS